MVTGNSGNKAFAGETPGNVKKKSVMITGDYTQPASKRMAEKVLAN